ncbi:MAG: hypothetical protein HYT46_01465 [Candidatus Vogelbacteria bacterium]|nr:hypothetical protein [Candidatus Vogelbacteria bacterium]
MKKFLVIILFIGLILPAAARAAAPANQETLILLLQQLVQKLQAQLLLLQSRPPLPTLSGQPPAVISPNGGESWTIGTSRLIRWQTDYTNTAVNLWLVPSVVTGSIPAYAVFSGAPNTGLYVWPAGKLLSGANAPAGSYRLRVCYFYPFNLCDESDAVFTLTVGAPTSELKILSPAGGETLTRGQERAIEWQGNGNGSLAINLINTANNWPYLLAAQAPNTGSFSWTVGQTAYDLIPPNGDYRLQICYFGSAVCAKSGAIKIVSPAGQTPSLVVLSPNGGERAARGANLAITWRAVGVETVSIFLVRAAYPNLPVRTIAVSLPAAAGAYNWVVPTALLAGGDYLIKITSLQLPLGDLSDSAFSVF